MATITGTNGIDKVRGTNDADTFNLLEGNDSAMGLGGNDVMNGHGGNDTLSGMDGNDSLFGGDGFDTLLGGKGSDFLSGGAGNDLMTGGAGADSMFGGTGADTFRYERNSDASGDRINDFSRFDGDRINLSAIDAKEFSLFSPGTIGNNAFTFIGTNSFTSRGQVHYSHSGGNTLVEGNTDGDSAAEFTITLTGIHNLQFSDFVL